MVQFRNQEKEIIFKVVYYGPALGGKTTNLETLHKLTDPEGRTKLTSLKTAEDRTLFFDLLPFDLGEIQGYRIRVQVYTVPGQVHYNTSRKIVLGGADAVVFVADAQKDRLEDNFVSWENMKANFLANKMDLGGFPLVLQLNKVDLPGGSTPEAVVSRLGVGDDRPVVTACALSGEGVVAAFRLAVTSSLCGFAGKFKLYQKGVTRERLEESLGAFFEPFEQRRLETCPPPAVETVAALPPKGMPEEAQLEAALRSTEEIAEQYNEVERLSKLYASRLREMTFIADTVVKAGPAKSLEEMMISAAAELQGFRKGSVCSLFGIGRDGFRHVVTLGAERDPVMALGEARSHGFLSGLFGNRSIMRLDDVRERLAAGGAPASLVPESLHALYFGPEEAPVYALLVYSGRKGSQSRDDERFLELFREALSREVCERSAADALFRELSASTARIRDMASHMSKHPEKWIQGGEDFLSGLNAETSRIEEALGKFRD